MGRIMQDLLRRGFIASRGCNPGFPIFKLLSILAVQRLMCYFNLNIDFEVVTLWKMLSNTAR